MKTKYFLFSAIILSACLARAQTPSGAGVKPAGQSGTQSSQTSGQRQTGQGTQRSGVQTQTGQTGTPGTPVTGYSGNVGTGYTGNQTSNTPPNAIGGNQPINPNQRTLLPNQPAPFGGTNQVAFGTTNRPFGSTNSVAFGATNGVIPFSTNAGPSPIASGTVINDASGAAANQNGTLLPPVGGTNRLAGQPNGAPTSNTEEVFGQRLRAALMQTGATKIYFPQTRSAVTVVNKNGTVILTGNVASEAEKREIEARIRGTQGVINVENRLQASASGRPLNTNGVPTTGDRRLLTP